MRVRWTLAFRIKPRERGAPYPHFWEEQVRRLAIMAPGPSVSNVAQASRLCERPNSSRRQECLRHLASSAAPFSNLPHAEQALGVPEGVVRSVWVTGETPVLHLVIHHPSHISHTSQSHAVDELGMVYIIPA